MAKQKIEIEVDIPDGYEATGEYRAPTEGETYLAFGVDVGGPTRTYPR